MKKYFYLEIILFILFSSVSIFSQESPIITISEKVGDTIDLKERNHFNLWPSFNGFLSAMILKDGQQNILIINYKELGKTETVQYVLSVEEYEHLQTWIENYEEIVAGSFSEPIEPFDIPKKQDLLWDRSPTKHPKVKISTIDGLVYQGKLLDIENEEECSIDIDNMIVRVSLDSIKALSYNRGRVKGKSILIGFVAGLAPLVVTGSIKSAVYNDEDLREVLSFLGIGLLGGIIVEVSRAQLDKRHYDFQEMNHADKVILIKRLLGKA